MMILAVNFINSTLCLKKITILTNLLFYILVSNLVDENIPYNELVQPSNVKDETSKTSTIKYF